MLRQEKTANGGVAPIGCPLANRDEVTSAVSDCDPAYAMGRETPPFGTASHRSSASPAAAKCASHYPLCEVLGNCTQPYDRVFVNASTLLSFKHQRGRGFQKGKPLR